LVRLHDKSAIFYSAENVHAYESGHVASGHFVFGRDVLCEFNYCLDYWPLAVSMPPTKVCPQCKAAVPVRRKICERCDLVFRFKQKAVYFARENSLTMERIWEQWNQIVWKAKGKLHKACERASETRERTLHGQEQNNVHGKHERVMRQ